MQQHVCDTHTKSDHRVLRPSASHELVSELHAAVAQARARVANSAQISVAAHEEGLNMSADLTV